MAGTLELDESGFPLVVVTFRGQMSASVLASYFARVHVWARDQLCFACVYDISRIEIPTAGERKAITDVMTTHEAIVERHCLGAAIVASNPLLRGMVTAILWIQPIKHPHAVVSTRREALTLCAGWIANKSSTSTSSRSPSRWSGKGSDRV